MPWKLLLFQAEQTQLSQTLLTGLGLQPLTVFDGASVGWSWTCAHSSAFSVGVPSWTASPRCVVTWTQYRGKAVFLCQLAMHL